MDLETFVRESLLGLAAGIKAANQRMNESDDPRRTYFTMVPTTKDASIVQFDVVVTASKEGPLGQGGSCGFSWPTSTSTERERSRAKTFRE